MYTWFLRKVARREPMLLRCFSWTAEKAFSLPRFGRATIGMRSKILQDFVIAGHSSIACQRLLHRPGLLQLCWLNNSDYMFNRACWYKPNRFKSRLINGGRIKWNLQNRTAAKRESDLLISGMITDRIGQQEVLLLTNQNYNKTGEYVFCPITQGCQGWRLNCSAD